MVSTALIELAVVGGIRLGLAGQRAYEQIVTDADTLFPDSEIGSWDVVSTVTLAFLADYPQLVRKATNAAEQDGPLAQYWDSAKSRPIDEAAADILFDYLLTTYGNDTDTTRKQMAAGYKLIGQWAEGAGPAHPFSIIAITMVDIGLEYIGAYPTTVGLNGNGGKFIAGIAARLSQIIPDDIDNFESKKLFGDKLIAIVLRAGLESLSENAKGFIGEEHLRSFAVESLKPIIEALPADLETQYKWSAIIEALSGPAFGAALGVMSNNPAAFFGTKFETGKAAGAILQKVLLDAAETSLEEVLSPAGMQDIVRSAVTAVAENPKLFVEGSGATENFKRDLLSKVAQSIKDAPSPFNGDIGAAIASAAIDALKNNATALLEVHDDWDEVVKSATDMVFEGFKIGIIESDGDALEKIFTTEQLKEIGRVFLSEVATNPSIVISKLDDGTQTKELRNVVAAVAAAMVADKKLLLSGNDWMVIARVATEEVARNPGVLVGLSNEKPEDAILSGLLTTLLTVAGEGFATGSRAKGNVAFGETLREAAIVTVRAASINIGSLAQRDKRAEIGKLVAWLKKEGENDPTKFGSKEWLKIYKAWLPRVITAGQFAPPTPAEIETILRGV